MHALCDHKQSLDVLHKLVLLLAIFENIQLFLSDNILKMIIFFLESCLIESMSLQREPIELWLLCHPISEAILDQTVEAVLHQRKRWFSFRCAFGKGYTSWDLAKSLEDFSVKSP